MMELVGTGKGKYDLRLNGRTTHEVMKIKVKADPDIKYPNGFKPSYVDRWVHRAVGGTWQNASKYNSLKNLLLTNFPFSNIKKRKATLQELMR